MDPVIQAVVNALAAGALAASKDVATDAVKKSYEALKSFIVGRVAHAAPFVDVVRQDPNETTASLLAKQITPIAGDNEAQKLAAELRAAIEQMGAQRDADAVVTLLNSTIGNFEASNNQSGSPLLNAQGSKAGDFKFTDNTFGDTTDKKKPPPSP